MLQSCAGLMGNPNVGYDHNTLGWTWAADNGCFSKQWDARKWLAWLDKHKPSASRCLFAVVPDVVGDHAATIKLWPAWFPLVRSKGYRVAFVAQNGCGPDDVPWSECDAVFIGGDDAYKLGPDARAVVARANQLGKWAHMGRVNSYTRLRYASDIGCDSADGTFVAFGPDVNVPKVARWIRALTAHKQQGTLFETGSPE